MKSFISLRTQFENLGDEVINALLLRELGGRMPVVALTNGVPEWYMKSFMGHLDKRSEVSFEPNAAKFYLGIGVAGLSSDRSYLFLSPGDTTSRGNGVPPRDRLMMAVVGLPRLRLANVGGSFSSLGEGRAQIFRSVLQRGAALSVRDLRTQDVAESQGIYLPIVPDLAYLLGRQPSSDAHLALISLRDVKAASDSSGALARFVRIARQAGLEPVVSWQVGRDRDYCAAWARKLGIRFIDFSLPRPNLQEAAALYRQCRVVFSNRLHVLLIAAAYGSIAVPFLNAAETKVRGVFETAGLDDLIVDSDRKLDMVGDFLRDFAKHDARFQNTFEAANHVLRSYFEQLTRLVRNP